MCRAVLRKWCKVPCFTELVPGNVLWSHSQTRAAPELHQLPAVVKARRSTGTLGLCVLCWKCPGVVLRGQALAAWPGSMVVLR